MAGVDFDDLPFSSRPDLTPYLIHLTRGTEDDDGHTALRNLANILRKGEVWGSERGGYIKGDRPAACFMDVPFAALKNVCVPRHPGEPPPYEPYGLAVMKQYAYKHGARPVLYLSNREVRDLNVPPKELWRVVRLEVNEDHNWISWLHEREWRCPDNFQLPANPVALVKTSKDVAKLEKMLADEDDDFKARPRAILPLNVICQGLAG